MGQLTPIPFQPNVAKDDSDYAASGAAINSDKIRWVRGAAQALGGWTRAGTDVMSGICRGADAYTTSDGDTYAVLGTHKKLYIFDGVRLWDITPIRSAATLGTDPFTTTAGGGSGQTVSVSVAHTSHGAIQGDTVYFTGASAFDNVTIGGGSGTLGTDPFSTTENSRLVVVEDTSHGLSTGDIAYFTGASAVGGITIGGSGSGSFGSTPFTTIEGSEIVTITLSSHGMFTGETITIASASAVNGITLDGDYTVTVVDANTLTVAASTQASADGSGGGSPTYTYERPYSVWVIDADSYLIEHPAAATSSADGGGGSVSYEYWIGYEITSITSANAYTIDVVASGAQSGTTGGGSSVEVQYDINVGLQDGIGGKGFGLGGFGQGGFGLNEPDVDIYQPRVWHIDNRGDYSYQNPLGGTIYEWTAILSRRSKALANAPAKVYGMLVTNEQAIMALGATSNEGDFQPNLIRYSDSTNVQIWTPGLINLAGDIPPLGDGSFLVTGRKARNGILVWTNSAMYAVGYTGQVDRLYDTTLVGTGSGALGPNAVVVDDGDAYWISRQRSTFVYRGGAPDHLPNPNRRWFENKLAPGQEYKVWGSIDNLYHGVFWLFPTTQQGDCDTYFRWDSGEDPAGRLGWSVGTFDRTAWLDNVVLDKPIAVDASGKVYFHEEGRGDNGDALTRFVEFAPVDIGGGDMLTTLKRIVLGMYSSDADNASFMGSLLVTVKLKEWPTSAENTRGPFTVLPGVNYPTANSTVIDVMAQARQIGMRFESTGNDDFWRLASVRADIGGGTAR